MVVAYNGTTDTGGNSMSQDLNVFYEVNHDNPVAVADNMLICCVVWKHSVGGYVHCPGTAHDPWRRVSVSRAIQRMRCY